MKIVNFSLSGSDNFPDGINGIFVINENTKSFISFDNSFFVNQNVQFKGNGESHIFFLKNLIESLMQKNNLNSKFKSIIIDNETHSLENSVSENIFYSSASFSERFQDNQEIVLQDIDGNLIKEDISKFKFFKKQHETIVNGQAASFYFENKMINNSIDDIVEEIFKVNKNVKTYYRNSISRKIILLAIKRAKSIFNNKKITKDFHFDSYGNVSEKNNSLFIFRLPIELLINLKPSTVNLRVDSGQKHTSYDLNTFDLFKSLGAIFSSFDMSKERKKYNNIIFYSKKTVIEEISVKELSQQDLCNIIAKKYHSISNFPNFITRIHLK